MANRIQYTTGEFIDFFGEKKKIVVVAYSCDVTIPTYVIEKYYDENMDEKDEEYLFGARKAIYFGVSFCRAEDTFDEKVGVKIAFNRAKTSDPVLIVSDPRFISAHTIEALLQRELQCVIKSPELYIKGYKERIEKVKYHQEMVAKEAALSDDIKKVVDILTTKDASDIKELLNIASWKKSRK